MPRFTANLLANPGLADVMVAAGIQSAGVCKLMSGGTREYVWQINQAPGVQGYTMTYRGWKAGDPIVFRFSFFEHPDGSGYASAQSQIQSFYNDWIPIWQIDARKLKPTPTAVSHPQISCNDIEAMVCKSIGPLETDDAGKWWVDMTFYEFRPPRIIATETPKGATSRLGQPTPQTLKQKMIAEEAVLAARPI